MHQGVSLRNIMLIGEYSLERVNKARVCICNNVGFNAEVSVVAFLDLLNLLISLAALTIVEATFIS